MFDAQAYLAALEKPAFKASDGTVFQGDTLSFKEAIALVSQFQNIGEMTPEQIFAMVPVLVDGLRFSPEVAAPL